MLASYEQPARLAHSDYTPLGALLQLRSSFPGQENHFENEEFDMIKSDACPSGVAQATDGVMLPQRLETAGRTERRLAACTLRL